MAVETNQDSQISPTPETNRFLEDIQQDASEILGWRQELGLRVKTTLAARAREFAGFGFFGRIPTTDDLWSDDAGGDDENSEQLGLAIDREIDSDDGYTHDGVVMTPDGVLWTGYANDGRWGEGFAFDFDAATEVPLEDYLRYFDEAIRAMKYTVDEKTGVHAAEFREEQARKMVLHVQQIEADNQRYGIEGAEFTSPYSGMIEKANDFTKRIARIREMVAQGDKGITVEQFKS
ncbi:MAG: hypothetical protein HYT09_00890 [Candidatus Levybacteria bacterium]|nr:hypothetical protein [Candidatus Levybacteria bacterium]